MKKFLATIFWNIAIFNMKIATKLGKSERTHMSFVSKIDGETITLAKPLEKPFESGDKILIVK